MQEETEFGPHGAVLRDLAPCKPEDVHLMDLDLLARGSDPQQPSHLPCPHDPAHHNTVVYRDDFLLLELHIRKHAVKPPDAFAKLA